MNQAEINHSQFFTFIVLILLNGMISVSCKPSTKAQKIVEKSIHANGLHRLENVKVSFDFRDIHYIYSRHRGVFKYTRIQRDSTGTEIRDVLTNEGLTRYIANTAASITDERRKAYSRSVNSVMYFAFLPLRLNDSAVNKRYIGIDTIKGKEYHQIEITFDQQGGGRDFEDIFVYWFDRGDYSMDYLAYQYFTDGGGIRFREAYNVRQLKSVTLQDYRNYKPRVKNSIPLEEIGEAYETGNLILLSRIELENVEIILN